MRFKTLRDLYLNSVNSYGSKDSMSMLGGEQLSYLDFALRVETVIEIMSNSGINSGDKVALLSSNMPNWNVCYFAAVISGVVIVPILPDFSGDETDKILIHSEVKALFVSDKLFSKVSKDVADTLNLVVRTKNLGIIHQSVDSKGVFTEPRSEDVAVIIYTSGTTSSPKGVMLSHYNLCEQMRMIYDLYLLNEQDVLLSVLPLSHTYECSVGMIYPFMMGVSMVYLDKAPTPSTLIPALQEVKPTFILSVPLIIEKIYRGQVVRKFSKNRFKMAIYSFPPMRKLIHKIAGKRLMDVFGGKIRFFGVGGAKLDISTELFLREAKFPYAIGYGLTETAPLIAGAIPGKVVVGSTGPALSGIELRLDNMNAETGEGEIVVKSPSTMIGYYKNPEATKDAFTSDGWFRTKDLGCIDKSGNIFIKGRLNNMIVGPSGENIYPEEIEGVLNSHQLIADAIVTQQKGKLVALINFNTEELESRYQGIKDGLGYRMEEIKADILHYVNSRVGKFSRITNVVEQKDKFEKTPTHKIKRFLYIKNSSKKK